MRWIAKAALQNALARMPRGREVNFLLQRRLTHTLPGNDEHFRLKARKALWHLAAFKRNHDGPVAGARMFEFGAGWDLIGPLIMYGAGIDDQAVIDVAPLLSLSLVGHAIRQYTALKSELEAAYGEELRSLGAESIGSREELRQRFGIHYVAPCDAAATTLAADSVDFVSSTSTLQHVPEDQIAPILGECRRLLRPGAAMSCHIDMPDGFAQTDSSLSSYNFLKFSNRTWALVNSAFYYQNRLRARDFVGRFEQAGFEVAERELYGPSERDLTQLRALRLAPRFRAYTIDELAVRQMSLVAINR